MWSFSTRTPPSGDSGLVSPCCGERCGCSRRWGWATPTRMPGENGRPPARQTPGGPSPRTASAADAPRREICLAGLHPEGTPAADTGPQQTHRARCQTRVSPASPDQRRTRARPLPPRIRRRSLSRRVLRPAAQTWRGIEDAVKCEQRQVPRNSGGSHPAIGRVRLVMQSVTHPLAIGEEPGECLDDPFVERDRSLCCPTGFATPPAVALPTRKRPDRPEPRRASEPR